LKIHRNYWPVIKKLLPELHGAAHITGGGFFDNIPRVLPKNCRAVLRAGSWKVLPIFRLLQQAGHVSDVEMHRVFNMGIGMVVFAAPDDLSRISRTWQAIEQAWYAIGDVRAGSRRIVIDASLR